MAQRSLSLFFQTVVQLIWSPKIQLIFKSLFLLRKMSWAWCMLLWAQSPVVWGTAGASSVPRALWILCTLTVCNPQTTFYYQKQGSHTMRRVGLRMSLTPWNKMWLRKWKINCAVEVDWEKYTEMVWACKENPRRLGDKAVVSKQCASVAGREQPHD